MCLSWRSFASSCKSRLSALARACFLSRLRWRKKFRRVRKSLAKQRKTLAESESRRRRLEQENLELRGRITELEARCAEPRPVQLPLGDKPAGQQFGAGMIVLCVNLARQIGLRPTVRALDVVFAWLGVEQQVPCYGSIRGWMQRIGLDRMKRAKKTAGGVWFTDHTNQVGKERVLVIMRTRDGKLPQRGKALRHEDMDVLEILPGTEWTRASVSRVYQATADRCGVPRGIVSDGAVELQEPIETLGKPGQHPLAIRDLKHYLANQLEHLLTKDPRYPEFLRHLGGARSTLQQTELAHFLPPSAKVKSRFMNLAPTLVWAARVIWHLEHPESRSREGVTERRMQEKLGWLGEFVASIRQWQECQEVISQALQFITRQGIFRGASARLEKILRPIALSSASRWLADRTREFLRQHEQRLNGNERLPMSTEILESSFSLYKQLERQHSKGGFGGLLLAFPILLRATTPNEVVESFSRVKVADVQAWCQKHLPHTLASKCRLMYREPVVKNPRPSATPTSAAA